MTMKILVTEEMASLTALGWKPRVLVDRSLFRASRLAQRVGQGARAPVTATQWEPNVGQFDSAPPHSLHGPIGPAPWYPRAHGKAAARRSCPRCWGGAGSRQRRHVHMAEWFTLIQLGILGELTVEVGEMSFRAAARHSGRAVG